MHLWVEALLFARGLSRGDDADDVAIGPVAVRHDQQPKAATQAEEQKALLFFRVVRVVDKACALVRKHSLRIFEGDTVLPAVDLRFLQIPLDAQAAHACSVRTSYFRRNKVEGYEAL
jgi:hypothetical protein